MSVLLPFLALDQTCEQVNVGVHEKLTQLGLRVVQTFDLHVARVAHPECPCPRHGTNDCNCQMIVLLVYEAQGDPATLIIHGQDGTSWLEYLGNDFDLTQPPHLKPGQQIIIPNGTSPIVWSEAQVPSAAQSGVRGGFSGNIPNLGSGYFSWPVNGYVLTQEYWSGHPGIDLSTDFRQPVFASDSGTVVFSGWDDTGYGFFVIIDHGNGYKTTYGHNEDNLVSVGQSVVQGQQITESGSTGNSTGNHLDFRILYNGVFLNPLSYLP